MKFCRTMSGLFLLLVLCVPCGVAAQSFAATKDTPKVKRSVSKGKTSMVEIPPDALSNPEHFCLTHSFEKARLDVSTDLPTPSYDHSKTSKEIAAMYDKGGGAASGWSWHTNGLTTTGFYQENRIGVVVIDMGQHGHCIIPKTVGLTLGYKKMDVYIEKKLPESSCAFDVVLRHENEHVRIFKESLTYYLPYLVEAATVATANLSPVFTPYDDVQNVVHQMQQDFDADMAPMLEFYKKIRDEQHGKLDTVENYAYTKNLCEEWYE